MAKYYSRGARLTALAIATGTLVVASTGTAGASTVKIPDVFGGKAQATAIHIEINLPDAIPTDIPLIGSIKKLTQDISFTDGNTAKGTAPQATSVAKAVLGNGNVVALSDLLGRTVESSLDGQHTSSDQITAQDVNGLIQVGVGQIKSSVAPDTASTGLTSKSSSSLAELKVGLGGLNLPFETNLTNALDQVQNTVDTAVQTAVDTATQTLDQVLGSTASQPVKNQADEVKNQLGDLMGPLTKTVDSLTSNTNLVDLHLLGSAEDITRKGAEVHAHSTSDIAYLDVLGGLVHLEGVHTDSHSFADGTHGGAGGDTLTTIAHLSVANTLDIALTPDGLEGTVLGNALPPQAKDAVKAVFDNLNNVLSVAGVKIIRGETHTTVDPNGKFASSSSDGVGISVNPLGAKDPLVLVQLVPAGTAVNAALAPPHKVPTFKKDEGTMPRTGAELPLFAMVGTGLVGAALVARRRRTVEI